MLIGCFSFVVLTLLFLYWLRKDSFFQLNRLPASLSYIALFLKVTSAFALWFVYTYYYTDRASSDIYKYFDDAAHLYNSTQNDWPLRLQILFGFQDDASLFYLLKDTQFWYSSSEIFLNDNRTMTRLHLAILPFSRGFYPFHVLFFAILSFIGSCGIFHFFRQYSTLSSKLLFAICFLIPSFLFWNSAPLKETVLIFSLGVFLFGLCAIQEKRNIKNLSFFTVGILGLLSLKLYLLFALLPGLWFWTSSNSNKSLTVKVRLIGIHLLVSTSIFSSALIQALSNKQTQFKQLIAESGANSGIEISSFDSSWSLLSTIPAALFNVLIRPVFPPNWNPFSLLSAAEHVVFIGIILLPFIYKKTATLSEHRLALFCISFVLISSCIIGLTVPVLGGIVRYKAPLIPFYLVAIFTYVNFSKFSIKLK